MKKLHYILIAVFAYLGFFIATLPALQAYSVLKNSLAPNLPVVLSGISGTVWSGNAHTALLGSQQLHDLSWEFRPIELFLGRVSLDVGFRNGKNYGKGRIARGLNGDIAVRNVEMNVDIDQIAPLKTYLPLGLEGSIGLQLQELAIEDKTIATAQGTLAWQAAGITSPQKLTLGDLRLTLETDNEGIHAVLADGGGPLMAEGVLLIKPDGNYQFSGSFASRDKKQQMLSNSLQFIGRPGPDGKVKVTQKGTVTEVMKLFSS